MDRCALFIDAGYALTDGAMAVHGTRRRDSVTWDHAGLLKLLAGLARDRTGLPVLRCYWYETAPEGRRTAEHDALAEMPGLKLRLVNALPGRREGIESQLRRDLVTLAKSGAISDAFIASANEQIAEIVAEVQDLGLRVVILHIASDGGWTIPLPLRQECDDLVEISGVHLRAYVDLVAGAEPASADARYPASAYGGHAQAEAKGAADGALTHQGLPAAALPAPGAVYQVPDNRDFQAQPGPGQPGGYQDENSSAQPQFLAAPSAGAGQAGQGQAAANAAVPGPAAAEGAAPPQNSGSAGPTPNGQQGPPYSAVAGYSGLVQQHADGRNGYQQGPVVSYTGPTGIYQNISAGSYQNGSSQNGVSANGSQNGAAQNGSGRNSGGQGGAGQGPARPAMAQNGYPADGAMAGPAAPSQNGNHAGYQAPGQNGAAHFGYPGGQQAQQPGPGGYQPGAADQASPPFAPPQTGYQAGQHGQGLPGGTPPYQFAPGQPGPAHQGQVQPGPGQHGQGQSGPVQNGATGGHVGSRPGQPAGGFQPAAMQPEARPRDPYPPGVPSAPPGFDPMLPSAGQHGFGQPGSDPGQRTAFGQSQAQGVGALLQAQQPPGSPAVSSLPPARPHQQVAIALPDAVKAAHAEGFTFGESVGRDAPGLWLEAVLARKPRMPSDLEARLLQGSVLPIDSLLHDEVRHSLRRGFWDALESVRR